MLQVLRLPNKQSSTVTQSNHLLELKNVYKKEESDDYMETTKWQLLTKMFQKTYLFILISNNWDQFLLLAPNNEILCLAGLSVMNFVHGTSGKVGS